MRRAGELLGQVNANVIGVVVNRVRPDTSYGYAYAPTYSETPKPAAARSEAPWVPPHREPPAEEPVTTPT